MPSIVEVMGALARGYTYPKNSNKVLDVDLVDAMAKEIYDLLSANRSRQRKTVQQAAEEGFNEIYASKKPKETQ